ncbi:MAG: hypothetical protein HN686_17780 [Bacteroidetes bacterium]|nr:hypothetical protein [Bacteroidota bacterium]MBT7465844.1 hypothetical protein [Bacteroidota bacterium]
MRTIVFFSLLILCAPNLYSQTDVDELPYLFNFTIELELSNDQGDMNTGEYLKNYGTKGKTRALDDLYPMLDSCFIKAMERKSFFTHPMKELSDIKSNAYGYPVMSLRKVLKSGKGKQFLRISLKDIGFVNPEQALQNNNQVKVIEMRCRIQLYDENKQLIRTAEATFSTGEKVDPKYNLGVDLRRFMGSGRTQELKFFEVCCKMAFFRAMDSF